MGWRQGLGLIAATLSIASATPATAEIRALLVGVGRYHSDRIPNLDGPHNDLPAMRELLIAQGAQDIVVLQDEAVTRSSLRQALRALGGRAKPGDWVVFYYAGHGTQAKAKDASEADGLDEFLPLSNFDPDQPDAEQYIVDNDLRAWLTRDVPANVNVLQIADACHSGTLNRSYQTETVFKARQVDVGDAYELPEGPTEPPVPDQAPNLVYIGASQDHQFALEGPMPQAASASRGVLTFALERVLRDRKTDGALAADLDSNGLLTLNELGAALDVRTRQFSRARQWPSVVIPPNNENSVVFQPLKASPAQPPTIQVFGRDEAAAKLLSLPGPWLAAAKSDADLVWAAGSGDVFDAQGDRIAEGVVDRAAMAGVVNKQQALALLYPLAQTEGLALIVGPKQTGERFRPGDSVRLSVTALHAGDYVTAFNLAGDGTVQLLYPLADDGDGRAAGAQALDLARTYATAPFGVDHVVVVASKGAPDVLRAAMRRMDGQRSPLAAVSAVAEALKAPSGAPARLALGELYTGE